MLGSEMQLSRIDRLFLEQCEAVKEGSHDPDRRVGVVVASATGDLLATGANMPPEALGLTRQESHKAIASDPNWKYFILEHAERNAINSARRLGHTVTGATMYGTLFPCADCARAIVAAGIKRLVVPTPDRCDRRDEKWQDHFFYAQQILNSSPVQIDLFEPADLVEMRDRCGGA